MIGSRFRRPTQGRRRRGKQMVVSLRRAFSIFPLFCLIAFAAPLHAQLTSDQLEVSIVPSATSRVISTFVVHNGSNHAAQAIITREDWDRAVNGENMFMPSGSTPHSCGRAMSFFPAAFLIEPGANQTVRLAVEKTSGTPPECWDIVFIQEVAQKKQLTRSGLQYVFRTGVKVYVAPKGMARDASITSMSLEQSNPAQRRISIQFRNSGQIHLAAKGRIEIRRSDNVVVAEVPIPEFPTLPGALRKLDVNVPAATPPGTYVALAMIDFGGSEIAAGELELTLH